MFPLPLLSVLAHHDEPGDPVLLSWVLHLFYSIVSLGYGAVVIVLGTIIVTIPILIMAAYFTQRAKFGS